MQENKLGLGLGPNPASNYHPYGTTMNLSAAYYHAQVMLFEPRRAAPSLLSPGTLSSGKMGRWSSYQIGPESLPRRSTLPPVARIAAASMDQLLLLPVQPSSQLAVRPASPPAAGHRTLKLSSASSRTSSLLPVESTRARRSTSAESPRPEWDSISPSSRRES